MTGQILRQDHPGFYFFEDWSVFFSLVHLRVSLRYRERIEREHL